MSKSVEILLIFQHIFDMSLLMSLYPTPLAGRGERVVVYLEMEIQYIGNNQVRCRDCH